MLKKAKLLGLKMWTNEWNVCIMCMKPYVQFPEPHKARRARRCVLAVPSLGMGRLENQRLKVNLCLFKVNLISVDPVSRGSTNHNIPHHKESYFLQSYIM